MMTITYQGVYLLEELEKTSLTAESLLMASPRRNKDGQRLDDCDVVNDGMR